ncbi:cupin domain-containing protein [Aspergillus stella-maris]|uniref:cupin domain-containing protein n=1 Tax=Aspergillus stella-maris TaxID=1810926 RepID=UPI003CCC9888
MISNFVLSLLSLSLGAIPLASSQSTFSPSVPEAQPRTKIYTPKTFNTTNTNTTFTGSVYQTIIHSSNETSIAHVLFTPSARTYWHTHEEGQILYITSGHGWIAELGEEPRRIAEGDVIFAPPGTTHWHGADRGSLMGHFVVGLGGARWAGPVGEGEYPGGRS